MKKVPLNVISHRGCFFFFFLALNYLHQLPVMCVFITAEVAPTHRDMPSLLDAHLWIIPAGDVFLFFFLRAKKKNNPQTVCTSGEKVHLLVQRRAPAAADSSVFYHGLIIGSAKVFLYKARTETQTGICYGVQGAYLLFCFWTDMPRLTSYGVGWVNRSSALGCRSCAAFYKFNIKSCQIVARLHFNFVK